MSAAGHDAILDAFALLRARNAGDDETFDSVLGHANTRNLAATLAGLAHSLLAAYARQLGVPPDQLPAAIEYQLDAGLARELLDDELGPADALAGGSPPAL